MKKIPRTVLDKIKDMAAKDRALLNELSLNGELEKFGYHPRLLSMHEQNADELEKILKEYGFPGLSCKDPAATEGAWLIVQHAISRPLFMKNCLKLMRSYTKEELPVKYAAYLEDRIAFYERKPQKYGTQFDYDLTGKMDVWWLYDPDKTEERRRLAGLPPLEPVRESFSDYPALSAKDALTARKEQERWLVETGWCTEKDIEEYYRVYGR